MKRNILFLIAAILIGCTSREAYKDIAGADTPIMPIHYTGQTMHVFLTDYLPQLTGEEQLTLETDLCYTVENYTQLEFDLSGDNTISTLTIYVDSTAQYDICILPKLPQKQALVGTYGEGNIIQFKLTDGTDRYQVRAYLDNRLLPTEAISRGEEDEVATLTIPQAPAGRSFLRVYAATHANIYNDMLIPLENGQVIQDAAQLTRHDDQAQVLYSLLVDRFCNGNPSNDQKLNQEDVFDIVDYYGGDISGITKKIKDGFFDELGINTIWVSPITQNPTDAWGKYVFKNGNKYDNSQTYTRFSGYHGYWPLYATKIDYRFGNDAELRELIDEAHKHDINIILDYVANHMHIASPTLQEHPTWHTDSLLPDGRRNFELWDEARLTTWFDVHIPTLDLEREDVCDPMSDSALYWLENYEFDGFRHDACKHIPECYWRMLTHKIKTRYPERHIWMIGETYGSPELINTYVKSGMLNAQFDFNVYFTAIHALAGDGRMSDVNNVILESLATYGAHHTMGNISGNHDQARFASLADGSVSFSESHKEAGWTRNVSPASEEAYKRATLLEVLNLTLPGVPCIYQGDEYGEVGAGDPDNRHPMRFDGLTEREQVMRSDVQHLIALRRHSMPLMYGEYIPVEASDNTLTFDRVYLGETVRVSINTKNATYQITNL